MASKRNNGIGLVNEINALLVEIMAGSEHFELATLLRHSCLVSSVIFLYFEAWYKLKPKKNKLLETEENIF